MQKRISIIVVIVIVVALGAWLLYHKPAPATPPPPPLPDVAGAPIGLIGTITEVGTSTITIEGQPPGNTSPITLQLAVGSSTTLAEVSATYSTSTITFADLVVGMRVNISADAANASGVRFAERITVIPSAQ